MSELPILIIGGAGKTGARVNALLRASGIATRRQIPSGFSSRSSGGSTAAGAFCHATGRRKRRIAVIPTEV